jgi:fluoroquinolone transport system permease protein
MQITDLVLKLGRNDVKLIRRDSFMLLLLGFILWISLILRYVLPWLNGYLAATGVLPGESVDATLAEYYPLIIGYLAIFEGALIVGFLFGFILLDEKDDNTLLAMLVTPLPLRQYLMYRVVLPCVLAFVVILAMTLFIGVALPSFWQLLLIAAGASLAAPIASLFFGIFAENKVQGFAYSKFSGLAGMLIIASWFVSEPLQWGFGIFPPFLISKAYWMAVEGSGLWWMILLAGVVLQIALIAWMMRVFTRVMYR